MPSGVRRCFAGLRLGWTMTSHSHAFLETSLEVSLPPAGASVLGDLTSWLFQKYLGQCPQSKTQGPPLPGPAHWTSSPFRDGVQLAGSRVCIFPVLSRLWGPPLSVSAGLLHRHHRCSCPLRSVSSPRHAQGALRLGLLVAALPVTSHSLRLCVAVSSSPHLARTPVPLGQHPQNVSASSLKTPSSNTVAF